MPQKVHLLDHLEHTYSQNHSTLTLTNKASVTLSSLHASSFPFSEVFERLESLLETRTWIAAKHRLHICFELVLDRVHIKSKTKDQFAKELGSVLCHAESWSRLGLDSKFNIAQCSDEDEQTNIKLSLTLFPHHGLDEEEHEGKEPPTFCETRPPTGVPMVILDNIDVLLHLSNVSHKALDLAHRDYSWFLRRQKALWEIQAVARRQRRQLLDDPGFGAVYNLGGRMGGETESVVAAGASTIFVEGELLDDNGDNVQQTSFLWGAPVQAQDHLSSQSSSTKSATFSQPSALSSQSSVATLLDAPSLRRTPSAECTTRFAQASFQDIVKIVDMSMRELFFGHKACDITSFANSGTGGHLALCRLSPSLFCPGYMTALSRRHALTATIANSLARISCRAQSSILRSKLGLLMHLRPERYMPPESHEYDQPDRIRADLKSAIQARLWFLMQDKMYDPTAPKSMESFKASNAWKHSHPAFDVLLEEGIYHSQAMNAISSRGDEGTELLLEEEDWLSRHSQSDEEIIFSDEDGGPVFESLKSDHIWSDEIPFKDATGADEEWLLDGTDAVLPVLDLSDDLSKTLLESSMQHPNHYQQLRSDGVDEPPVTQSFDHYSDNQLAGRQRMLEVDDPEILWGLQGGTEEEIMLLDD